MKIEFCSEFEGSPDPMWFFTRGHIDKGKFLTELKLAIKENTWKLSSDWLPDYEQLSIENVTCEWWHFYPTGIKDPKGAYAQTSGPGRGNFPVMVYNVDYRMGDSEDIGLLLHDS